MAMRAPAWWLMVPLIAGTCASALACSIGSGIREDDLAVAYRHSSHVFVARLTGYRKVGPPVGGTHMQLEADYELVESIKGRPAARGVLFETDWASPLPGHPPGPACGPWLLSGREPGALALVLATEEGAGRWRVAPFSRTLIPTGRGWDEDLDIILRIHEQSTSPGDR